MKSNRRIRLAVGSRRARIRFALMADERLHDRVCRNIMRVVEAECAGLPKIPQLKKLERSIGVPNEFLPQGGFWFGMKSDPTIDDWSNSVKISLMKENNARLSMQ